MNSVGQTLMSQAHILKVFAVLVIQALFYCRYDISHDTVYGHIKVHAFVTEILFD